MPAGFSILHSVRIELFLNHIFPVGGKNKRNMSETHLYMSICLCIFCFVLRACCRFFFLIVSISHNQYFIFLSSSPTVSYLWHECSYHFSDLCYCSFQLANKHMYNSHLDCTKATPTQTQKRNYIGGEIN